MFLDEVAVGVPRAEAAGLVEDLGEAHPALREAARHQAHRSKIARLVFVEAVEFAGFLGFLLQVEGVRHRGLHAGRQFIRLDPRGEVRIVRVLDVVEFVEILQDAQLGRPFLGKDRAALHLQEGERILAVQVEPHPAVLRAEIARAVDEVASAASVRRLPEHHELGQVLVQRSQAVGHPRTDRRQPAFE